MPTISLKNLCTKTLMTLLLSGLLISCSTVSIKKTRVEPDAGSKTYQKLLVVGVTQQRNMRDSFESIFSGTLSDHGVAAVSSIESMPDLSNADQVKIKELAQQVGADGVIITWVLSRSDKTSADYARGQFGYVEAVQQKSDGDSTTTVAMSAFGIIPGEMHTSGADLLTRLFDVESTRLVWSALSRAGGGENSEIDICWQLSAELTKALSKDKLIKINSRKFPRPSF